MKIRMALTDTLGYFALVFDEGVFQTYIERWDVGLCVAAVLDMLKEEFDNQQPLARVQWHSIEIPANPLHGKYPKTIGFVMACYGDEQSEAEQTNAGMPMIITAIVQPVDEADYGKYETRHSAYSHEPALGKQPVD
jgi:hypothetical protein